MPYPQIDNYVSGQLAADVAAYLAVKTANFPNIGAYYAPSGYFNEYTVQAAMFICLDRWLTANENPNHFLLLSEFNYPNFVNRADIAVIFNSGAGPSNLFIELKADFTPQSVNNDIDVLDAVAGLQNSALTDGYAFYVYRLANAGWTRNIDIPTAPNVYAVGIGI